jgi:hypothetical protein
MGDALLPPRHGPAGPQGLLEGQGSRVRSIRLETPAVIDTPGGQALIAQATLTHAAAFLVAPTLATIVKSVAAKQRSRRPAARASMPSTRRAAARP